TTDPPAGTPWTPLPTATTTEAASTRTANERCRIMLRRNMNPPIVEASRGMALPGPWGRTVAMLAHHSCTTALAARWGEDPRPRGCRQSTDRLAAVPLRPSIAFARGPV